MPTTRRDPRPAIRRMADGRYEVHDPAALALALILAGIAVTSLVTAVACARDAVLDPLPVAFRLDGLKALFSLVFGLAFAVAVVSLLRRSVWLLAVALVLPLVLVGPKLSLDRDVEAAIEATVEAGIAVDAARVRVVARHASDPAYDDVADRWRIAFAELAVRRVSDVGLDPVAYLRSRVGAPACPPEAMGGCPIRIPPIEVDLSSRLRAVLFGAELGPSPSVYLWDLASGPTIREENRGL